MKFQHLGFLTFNRGRVKLRDSWGYFERFCLRSRSITQWIPLSISVFGLNIKKSLKKKILVWKSRCLKFLSELYCDQVNKQLKKYLNLHKCLSERLVAIIEKNYDRKTKLNLLANKFSRPKTFLNLKKNKFVNKVVYLPNTLKARSREFFWSEF